MNRRLGKTPFSDLLPPSISTDGQIKASANALDEIFNKCIESIPEILIFARLANDSKFINPVPMLPSMQRLAELAGGLKTLPSELLDLLAWQLHVESYNEAVSLQAKREMIQSSLLLHRRHGTPWSVRHALATLLRVPAFIRQWFEYGGEPYFFRARLDVSGTYVDIRWLLSAFQIVMDYKNVRSWLEWLETFATIEMTIRTGIGVRSNVHDRQMLFFPYAPMPKAAKRTGVNLSVRTKIVYFMRFPSSRTEESIYAGINLRLRTISQVSIKE